MSLFISNYNYAFDVEKIISIRWNNLRNNCEIRLIENHKIELSYDDEDDFNLINDLREEFGYEPFKK